MLAGKLPKTSEAIYKIYTAKKRSMIVKPIWLRPLITSCCPDDAIANAIIVFEKPNYRGNKAKVGKRYRISKR